MDFKVGLIIQFAGISLITVLLIFLTTSLKSTALKYWKYAWLSLSLSLLSLYFAFSLETAAKPFYALYYFGEYLFAYFLIAGCQSCGSDKTISRPSRFLLIPAFSSAFLLAFLVDDFNEIFNVHSFIMGTTFVAAYFSLKSAKPVHDNFGWRVMKTALALLALDFFHYTLIYCLRHTSYPQLLGKYLTFNSVIDLVIEILLGFGMVIVLLEKVRRDVEETNSKLKEAHDKLERLAHVDPLTAAFTRHAFYSFLQKQNHQENTVSGCVGVFDIDNLKPINDCYGHAAGDVAISKVAHAIRSLVRADDLIFRWGGDEFFVVMLGFDTKQANERMSELNRLLEETELFGVSGNISIGVSFGFADFSDIMDLEDCIKRADAEMYRAKQQSKRLQKTETVAYLPPATTASDVSANVY